MPVPEAPVAASGTPAGFELWLTTNRGPQLIEANGNFDTRTAARHLHNVIVEERRVEIRKDPIAAAVRRLEAFRSLQPGWDSYGADRISGRAIRTMKMLLRELRAHLAHGYGERLQPYHVAPVADGSVQVEWRGAGGALEVEVDPDGEFSYLLISGEGAARSYQQSESPVTVGDVLRILPQVVSSRG